MSALFSLVYDQAPFWAALVAAAYAVLAVQGWMQRGTKNPPRWVPALLLGAALVHTLLLAATVWMPQQAGGIALNLGFAQALSLVTCVGVWLFMVESRWVAIDALRPLALALPCAAVLLAAFSSPKPVVLHSSAALHVLAAIAAHGVALLACGHAVLLLALNRVLRHGVTTGWAQVLTQHCPPLVVLERLVLRLSVWVAGLLAVTVALGLLGGVLKLDHKTVLTVLSLLAWLAVAWGYKARGWRATKLGAAVFTATGLLLLAYIGTRFVLQAVLHR